MPDNDVLIGKRVRIKAKYKGDWAAEYHGMYGTITMCLVVYPHGPGFSVRIDGDIEDTGHFFRDEFEIIEVDNKPLPLPG